MSDSSITVVNQTATVVVTPTNGPSITVQSVTTPQINISNIGTQGPQGSRLVELLMTVSSTVPPNKTYRGYLATAAITLIPADAVATAGTANVVSTTITITTLTGTVVGTVVFAPGATTGTVVITNLTLNRGQGLVYSTDANALALSDIIISIPASRTSNGAFTQFGGSSFYYDSNNSIYKVGIGVPAPSEALDILGNIKSTGTGLFGGTLTSNGSKIEVNGTNPYFSLASEAALFQYNSAVSQLNIYSPNLLFRAGTHILKSLDGLTEFFRASSVGGAFASNLIVGGNLSTSGTINGVRVASYKLGGGTPSGNVTVDFMEVDANPSLYIGRDVNSGGTGYPITEITLGGYGFQNNYAFSVGSAKIQANRQLVVNQPFADPTTGYYSGSFRIIRNTGSGNFAFGIDTSDRAFLQSSFNLIANDLRLNPLGGTVALAGGVAIASSTGLAVTGNLSMSGTINGLTIKAGAGSPSNIAIGPSTMLSALAQSGYNVAAGYYCLPALTTGFANVAIGGETGVKLVDGSYNVAVGSGALHENISGSNNVAIGTNTLQNSVDIWNVAVGGTAGSGVTSGRVNTFVGHGTGLGITIGSYNTILGAQVTGLAPSLSNNVIIADGSGAIRYRVDANGQHVATGDLTVTGALTASQLFYLKGGAGQPSVLLQSANGSFYHDASTHFFRTAGGVNIASIYSGGMAVTGDLAVSGAAYFGNVLTLNGDGTTRQALTAGANLLTVGASFAKVSIPAPLDIQGYRAVKSGDYLFSTAAGGSSNASPLLLNGHYGNVFYNYQNRCTVVDTGTLAAGSVFTRQITFSPAEMRDANGLTYGDGFVCVGFYANRGAASVRVRFYNGSAATWGLWSAASNISTDVNWDIWKAQIGGNYLTKIEVEITAQATIVPLIYSIEYFPSRDTDGLLMPTPYVQQGGDIITLGGSKAAHVSLRRNGTQLRVRLGDDSGFAPIQAGPISTTAGTFAGANGQQIAVSANDGTPAYLGIQGNSWNVLGLWAPGSTGLGQPGLGVGQGVTLLSQPIGEYATSIRLNPRGDIGGAPGVLITSGGASVKTFAVRGYAAQTANLQEWQNDTGATVGYITPGGTFSITGSSSFTGNTSVGGMLILPASPSTPSITFGNNTGAPFFRNNATLSERFLCINSGSGAADSKLYLNIDVSSDIVMVQGGGKVGINSIGAIATKLQVGSKIYDDASQIYDSDALMVVNQTTTGNTLNDPRTTLILGRQGVGGVSYGAAASFALSRYEINGTDSRTRLDLRLAHASFDYTSNTSMTWLSNGNVGINQTAPTEKLDIVGNAKIKSGGIDYATKALTVKNSSSTNLFSVTSDGRIYAGPDNGQNAILNVNRTTGNLVGDMAAFTNADGVGLSISSSTAQLSTAIIGTGVGVSFCWGNTNIQSQLMKLDASVGALNLTGPVKPGVYTVVTLPSAVTYQDYHVMVSNSTRGRRPAYSDGTNWRFTADDVIVT